MDKDALIAALEGLIAELRAAGWKEREAVKERLLATCQAHPGPVATEYLEGVRRDLPLEVRWEVDEVLEALAPPPAPEEPEEPEEEAPPDDGRLRMSDLKCVYEDPRGLALFTDKPGARWFLQQLDPYTGQPVMQEIPAEQIPAVKAQLKGSPYWRLGSGVLAG